MLWYNLEVKKLLATMLAAALARAPIVYYRSLKSDYNIAIVTRIVYNAYLGLFTK